MSSKVAASAEAAEAAESGATRARGMAEFTRTGKQRAREFGRHNEGEYGRVGPGSERRVGRTQGGRKRPDPRGIRPKRKGRRISNQELRRNQKPRVNRMFSTWQEYPRKTLKTVQVESQSTRRPGSGRIPEGNRTGKVRTRDGECTGKRGPGMDEINEDKARKCTTPRWLENGAMRMDERAEAAAEDPRIGSDRLGRAAKGEATRMVVCSGPSGPEAGMQRNARMQIGDKAGVRVDRKARGRDTFVNVPPATVKCCEPENTALAALLRRDLGAEIKAK
ncbi:hypothetical protein B0H12DRAFT_1080367 [Mycena haematopus]|nr:hypothetical protein B0H12DRAFT_1080367 [Mycena haematopus]